MEIYNYADDALVQVSEAYQDESGTWLPKPCASVEDMDGVAAINEISEALDAGCEPLVVNGKVMGYYDGVLVGEKMQRVIDVDGTERVYLYCNCDEYTYEEYYGFPYED